jgi:hypothetical protein
MNRVRRRDKEAKSMRAILYSFGLSAMMVSAFSAAGEAPYPTRAPDLNPVRTLPVAAHAPVALAGEGIPPAALFVAEPQVSETLRLLLEELQSDILLTFGAGLEVVTNPPAADRAAIVVGAGPESRAAGIDDAAIPVEGFVVKTASNRVFLVGSTAPLPAGSGRNAVWLNDGTAWAVADFLERFVGVRWFWPTEAGGRSLIRMPALRVGPVHYADAPVFRKRDFYPRQSFTTNSFNAIWSDKASLRLPESLLPAGATKVDMRPLLAGLRAGNSWPFVIKVHEPQAFWRDWDRKWSKEPPEVLTMFALRENGTRHLSMLCYNSPRTLDYLLAGCESAWDKGKPASWVTPTCVTVSPGDHPVRCFCEPCRSQFDANRNPYGSGSRTMGLFVKRFCEAVKERWPDKKVLYLPYYNYTDCPEEIEFPDNLEVEMCTMAFGLMRQAEARARMEAQLRAWSRKAGGPVATWEYSHRVPEWAYAPVQYPHLVQDYYRANRDILAGSFLNGGKIREWSTGAPTDYVWMKVLWNPEVNVEALLDVFCERQFGLGAPASRELLRLMGERWEKAPWRRGLGDAGRLSPEAYLDTWPPEVVARMAALRDQARGELSGDPLAERRFAYWTWTFDRFLQEAKGITAQAATATNTPADGKVVNQYD